MSMTLERVELDESILEDEAECEIDQCTRSIEWEFRCRFCGNGGKICSPHKVKISGFFDDMQAKGKALECRGCHGTAHEWRELVEFRPI